MAHKRQRLEDIHGGHEARDNLNREIKPISCWIIDVAIRIPFAQTEPPSRKRSNPARLSHQEAMAREKRKVIPAETRNAIFYLKPAAVF